VNAALDNVSRSEDIFRIQTFEFRSIREIPLEVDFVATQLEIYNVLERGSWWL